MKAKICKTDAGLYVLFVNSAGSASWEMLNSQVGEIIPITVITAWAHMEIKTEKKGKKIREAKKKWTIKKGIVWRSYRPGEGSMCADGSGSK